jgi:glycosyltransferase involved in cell wall biosynthesis
VHTAERVGPPIVLLHFLNWLAAHTDVRIETLVWNDGPLIADFAALGPVHRVETLRQWALPRRLERVRLRRLAGRIRGLRLRWWLWRIRRLRTVCVVCVSPWPVLRYVAPRRPRVVTLVHELDLQLVHLDHDDGRLRRLTDHWVAGGATIRDRLVAHGVPRHDIGVAYEFIDDAIPPPTPAAVTRAELGIGTDDVVVGACGVLEWRKAPDLFVQVAAAARRDHADVPLQFVWVGGDDPGLERRMVEDVRRAGLEECVHFVGRQAHRFDWYRLFDLFLLPSREDAFPLVCLENALLGRPIVCFDAGGMPEFVQDDAGVVVPFPDVEAMAATLAGLAGDPGRMASLGRGGSARVKERHTVGAAAPRLYAELEPYLR